MSTSQSLTAARVLLVEDDALFRETVRETLVEAGYTIDEAGDGPAALRAVASHHHDLVLLDFDLPGMRGDEVLERMLALHPGLVCLVLSGKNDLHQALRMGRRGAYGWIDKFVGQQRLLEHVSAGVRTRPAGYDLLRLVTRAYPQPIAVPYAALAALPSTASPTERLTAAREVIEALVAYLGVTALATYIERGVMDQPTSQLLAPRPGVSDMAAWHAVVETLLSRFAADDTLGWWHDVARSLTRPAAGSGALAKSAELLAPYLPGANAQTATSVWGWFTTLLRGQTGWTQPERLSAAELVDLARALTQGVDAALAELVSLADTQLWFVERVSIGAEGLEHRVWTLAGNTLEGWQLEHPTALVPDTVYLGCRAMGTPLAPLHPLLTYTPCNGPGLAGREVFILSLAAPLEKAVYISHGCRRLHADTRPSTRSSIERLLCSLDPDRPLPEGQTRVVAVVLADMCDYTGLTRTRGAGAARELVRRMVAVVTRVVQQHGGQVGGSVGDEVLAYFAEPSGAVVAAKQLLAMLAQANEQDPSAAIHLRVGIDLGPAAVEGSQVWGDVINRAKRCQAAADPDGIVVSEAVRAATGINAQPITAPLKGFGDAEVYRVGWRVA